VGVEAAFDQRGGFVVHATPSAPSDWIVRLRSVTSVQIGSVYLSSSPANCPARDAEGTPPADAAHYAPHEQVDTILRVSFTQPATGYDAALAGITELGLRLADPCYEQGHAQDKASGWHAMGQEVAFARDGTLVLAVGPEASERWRAQAAAMSGVLGVDTPLAATCGQ
jgi:hypothetical protein